MSCKSYRENQFKITERRGGIERSKYSLNAYVIVFRSQKACQQEECRIQ